VSVETRIDYRQDSERDVDICTLLD